MPVFGSFSVQISPKTEKSKVEIRPVSIDDSSCVHLGQQVVDHLEGRCSIQLSYGRSLTWLNLAGMSMCMPGASSQPGLTMHAGN